MGKKHKKIATSLPWNIFFAGTPFELQIFSPAPYLNNTIKIYIGSSKDQIVPRSL